MNREIKFRAWDKRYNKMIFTGFHLLGEVMAFSQIEQYLFETQKSDGISTIERWNDIIIMQFTGHKDKFDNDIYEGDFIKAKFGELGIIVWNECICAFQYAYRAVGAGASIGGRMTNTLYDFDKHEIVGNIYQTPELINQ